MGFNDFWFVPLLAVVGVDDLVLLGIGAATLAFVLRQDRAKSKFLRENIHKIQEQNEQIADAWRASNPQEKKLVVDRDFKAPGFFSPTVHVNHKFKRDPRPWYRRLIS